MNIDEIHKARRMMKAIYRLADQPDAVSLSDIRYFARAGVIQLNRMLEQAGRDDNAAPWSSGGMATQLEPQRLRSSFAGR